VGENGWFDTESEDAWAEKDGLAFYYVYCGI
jgi:hypothetical protein